MTAPDPNPLVTAAKTTEAIELAKARATGQLLVDSIRQGEVDAHEVADAMRRQVLSAWDPNALLGFAAAIVEALQRRPG